MPEYGAIGINNEQPGDARAEGKDDFFTKVLLLAGFTANPLKKSSRYSDGRNKAAMDMRMAMLSAFSTDYNIVSISLALHIIEHLLPGTSITSASICSSALIAGMIAGQLGGGALGDLLGRNKALNVVMLMQVISAFMSALSVDFSIGSTDISMFSTLACKFWKPRLQLGPFISHAVHLQFGVSFLVWDAVGSIH